jgi:hypothetical protein
MRSMRRIPRKRFRLLKENDFAICRFINSN